jgi:phenylacetate-CoA ligase
MGRTTDVFRLANGDAVPGVALTNRVLQVCPGLKKTQVIQETFTDFRVRYVPGPGFSRSELDLLGTNLKRFLSDQVRWTFEQVPDIERERSGKTRFCISRVANPPIGSGCAVGELGKRKAN